MGNCLPLNNSDGVSLLRGSESITEEIVHPEPEQQMHQQQGSPYSELLQPGFYQPPTISRPTHLTEDEEIKIAKRMGLIQHLPTGTYNGSKKSPECVICMIEFCVDEPVRFLPCMHLYHLQCIDDWLLRSLTCPSCLEPVDSALLNSYETS